MRPHPEGTIFQMPEMHELFKHSEKFEPLVLAVLDDKEEICGLLLGVFIHEQNGIAKRLSSRFIVYGGPLLTGSEDLKIKSLNLLLGELVRQTQQKAIFIQFRNFTDQKNYLPVFERHGFTFLERLNYIVRVRGTGDGGRGANDPASRIQHPGSSSFDFVLNNISESRRRQIKKALNSGAEIIAPENIAQVKDFYNILYKLYRYKIQKPLPDWSFFENFYNLSIDNPAPRIPDPGSRIGIIRLIRFNGRIIGGILAPVFKDQCIYEWYVCGLDSEYKNQFPSVLATWAAIDYAIENNIRQFDFMGVGIPGREYGVREFKARFGGQLVNYGRLTRINNKSLYHISELGYNILASFKKI